ncbi:MAG: VapC toxin family PIN domain ribonuclease [Verrucomicrobia bacterium]|nr:VapC toxin family PIN domain ribonuclease [Verrucomicrobiota bacterium]
MHLLDANLLIALGDSQHVHHRRAQSWFHSQPRRAWATCPLTENAFLRILGSPGYPGKIGDPTRLRTLLQRMCAFPGHQFWADDFSLRDTEKFPTLPTSKYLTDIYLLALATKHHAQLASLDQRIDPHLVQGGRQAYLIIP